MNSHKNLPQQEIEQIVVETVAKLLESFSRAFTISSRTGQMPKEVD
jgi:hypothetical protein